MGRCEICGAKIKEGRFCPNCDKQIEERAAVLIRQWQQAKRG
mgnify:CR=1 FL=1